MDRLKIIVLSLLTITSDLTHKEFCLHIVAIQIRSDRENVNHLQAIFNWLISESCFWKICIIYTFLCNKVFESSKKLKYIYFKVNISKEYVIANSYSGRESVSKYGFH